MTRQVQLSDAAYNLLRRQKRGDESFSKVVERLCGSDKDPLGFIGGNHSTLSVDERLRLARESKGPVL